MSRLTVWKQSFEDSSISFETSFGRLNSGELNWKPHESAWSVGQIIDHLIRINESYYPLLDELKRGRNPVPWIAKIRFIPPFFGKFILKSVEPERKKKMKTFPVWEPTSSSVSDDIVERFTMHHRELVGKLDTHEHLFGKGTVISSPANRYVVYPLETAIEILIQHERRHYNQALEVLALQKGTQY